MSTYISNAAKNANHIYSAMESHLGTPTGLCYGNLSVEDHLEKFKIISSLIARRTSPLPPTILDVGCGYATLLEVYDRFTSYTGIDQTEWILNYAIENVKRIHGDTLSTRGVDFHLGTLGSYPFETADHPSYDVVLGVGLTVTLPPDEVIELLYALKKRTKSYLILGVQSYVIGGYKGSLYAYDPDFITKVLQMRLVELHTTPNNTEIILAYEK